MRTTRILSVFALLAASVLLFPYHAYAKSDAEMAIALSKKLNEIKMFDYSELVLEQEIAKNGPETDLLKIQKGMTYFLSNKADDANKIITSILATSKYYPDSRRALGMEAVKKQKFDMAITALEEYFKVYLATPPTTDEGKKEFIEAANYLIYAYKQTSKVKEAEKAATYLDALEKGKAGDGDKQGDDRDTKLRQLQIKMDTVEEMIDKKQEGWKTIVNDSFVPLKDLLWTTDAIAGLAYIEQARGYYYLDRLDDALKTLKDQNISNLINSPEINAAYSEQGMMQISPSVYHMFWLGRIYLKKANAATTEADKIAFYSDALQNFFKIIKDSRYDKFPRQDDALSGFSECRDRLEKDYGKKINPPENVKQKLSGKGKNKGPSLERKEADQYFADKKYPEALALYRKAILTNRRAGDADITLARLAFCYINTDQALESMAIATYLCDYYPTSENTPTVMVQTGEIIWAAATAKKKEKDEKAAESLFDDAILVYNSYLKNCPSDQWAGDVSARIAKYYYTRATELAKNANALPQGDEKAKKAIEARDAFRNTAPYYQNIASNFEHTKWGISSIYSLAWCYTNALDYAPGAENFLKFCDKEMAKEADKDIGAIADAKMRAADNYIQYAKSLDKEAEAKRNKSFEQGTPVPAPAQPDIKKDLKKDESGKKDAPKKDEAAEKEVTELKEAKKDDAKEEPMTPVQLNAKADELNKEAIENYKTALIHLTEMLDKWCGPGGILENSKDEKITKAIESASSLLGWAYDGAKEKENACKAFDSFIKKYPSSKIVPTSMLRMGLIYGDMGKFDVAGQVLETLADKFPQSPEGKSALATLARNMYEIKNFDKCIEVFGKIFTQNVELTPQDMRWACDNLSDCDGKHPKQGAEMAVKAGEMLLARIDKLPPEELIGKTKTRETAGNLKDRQKLMNSVKDKLNFDYATACYWAEQNDKALKAIDEILVKENSAYYFDGRFLRSMIYRAMKNYPKALENYGEITMTAMSAASKKPVLYSKAQCLMGDTFMEANDFKKAYASLNITATGTPEDIKDSPVKLTKEETQELINWLEYAVYKSAYCAAKLGNNEERDKMVEKYKKLFPDGKFAKDINSLPAPDAAAQAGPAPAPAPGKTEAPKGEKPPAKPDEAKKK